MSGKSFTSERGLTWNTFPYQHHRSLRQVFCQTERHHGRQIPATQFQIIWTKNPRNLVQSPVHLALFTCNECAVKMGEAWESLQKIERVNGR